MSGKSIKEACDEQHKIKALLERARSDEVAKNELEANAVRYISSLLECVETYDEVVSYQESIEKSLQQIADSSGRRADIYEGAFANTMQTLKHIVEAIPEIVNASVNKMISDLISQLNAAGIFTRGIGLEHREPLEFLKPITIDLDQMETLGGLEPADKPKLTLYAVSSASLLIKTEEAIKANRESGSLEFKEGFHPDPLSKEAMAAWCEIIKDIVAMANSNGGFILLGVRDDGTASGVDVTSFANIDPAKITDKLYAYTGTHFDKFHLSTEVKDGKQIAVIQVEEADNLLVFRNPGNYIDGQGKQKSAFTVGAIYVRHGAKSEPCTAEDIIGIFSRRVTTHVSKMLEMSGKGATPTKDESGSESASR